MKKTKTCSLKARKSKVEREKAGKPFEGGSFGDFLGSLPGILAADDFKAVVNSVIKA
ncbi:MAG: hypothetical protein JRI91_16700, partial [Deltaproteobacteria bacterium]|nr:hypothetical protein [Deltaproteobacteria bacterium]